MKSKDSHAEPVDLMTDMLNEPHQITVADTYEPNVDVVLFDGDCSEFLKDIPSNSVDLIITSPPYNIGKKIRKKKRPYIHTWKVKSLQFRNYTECLLLPEISVGKSEIMLRRERCFPLDIYFYEIFKRFDLKLRNRIIWRFNHGLHCSKRFSGRYEVILWFTKSDDYIFNLDPVRVPAKIPRQATFQRTEERSTFRQPTWQEPFWYLGCRQTWLGRRSLGYSKRESETIRRKTEHPCQFPIELVQRCVLALTQSEGVVLDPYCGVGSTIIAALQHGRKAIAAEQDSRYIAITRERIQKFEQGVLPLRPLGKTYSQTNRKRMETVTLTYKRPPNRVNYFSTGVALSRRRCNCHFSAG